MKRAAPAVEIDAALLRRWPLVRPDPSDDKEARGSVLVVAGSREIPGAALLAATGALRAGAGKATIATGESVAAALGVAVPEARVVGLPETKSGALAAAGVARLEALVERADAVLVGPGLTGEGAAIEIARALLKLAGERPVVVDAAALGVVGARTRFARPPLLTPHAGEMAHLTGADKEQVAAEPLRHAKALAERVHAIVALKGAVTSIAAPDGRCWRHAKGLVGLATSGSGDVLAGVIAGLAARTGDLAQAAAWGVWLHARAGQALQRRHGPIGFLPRELLDELPRLLARASTRSRR